MCECANLCVRVCAHAHVMTLTMCCIAKWTKQIDKTNPPHAKRDRKLKDGTHLRALVFSRLFCSRDAWVLHRSSFRANPPPCRCPHLHERESHNRALGQPRAKSFLFCVLVHILCPCPPTDAPYIFPCCTTDMGDNKRLDVAAGIHKSLSAFSRHLVINRNHGSSNQHHSLNALCSTSTSRCCQYISHESQDCTVENLPHPAFR